jgi:hypothetical protein
MSNALVRTHPESDGTRLLRSMATSPGQRALSTADDPLTATSHRGAAAPELCLLAGVVHRADASLLADPTAEVVA